MATSDNVLRAGLTPKHRDVDNLLASLTWTFGATHAVTPHALSSGSGSETSKSKSKYSMVYDPPAPEFAVVRAALPPGGETEAHGAFTGPSILIVTHGVGTLSASAPGENNVVLQLQEGCVVFVAAGVEVTFASGPADRLVLYRAYYP